jgi:hypothetical protein
MDKNPHSGPMWAAFMGETPATSSVVGLESSAFSWVTTLERISYSEDGPRF